MMVNRRWSGLSASTKWIEASTASNAGRPHTAHGTRGNDPTSNDHDEHFLTRVSPAGSGAPAPVVAGARGMMR